MNELTALPEVRIEVSIAVDRAVGQKLIDASQSLLEEIIDTVICHSINHGYDDPVVSTHMSVAGQAQGKK
jgi:hypothetical protein